MWMQKKGNILNFSLHCRKNKRYLPFVQKISINTSYIIYGKLCEEENPCLMNLTTMKN